MLPNTRQMRLTTARAGRGPRCMSNRRALLLCLLTSWFFVAPVWSAPEMYCREGRFDGVNCVVHTLSSLGLRGRPDSYRFVTSWHERNHQPALQTAAVLDRTRCAYGLFDGVNCVLASASEMKLREPGFAYKYDPQGDYLWRPSERGVCPLEGVLAGAGRCKVAQIERRTGDFKGKSSKSNVPRGVHPLRFKAGPYWYDARHQALYGPSGVMTCREGTLEDSSSPKNCNVAWPSLRDVFDRYWYDAKHGGIYRAAERRPLTVAVRLECYANGYPGGRREFGRAHPDCSDYGFDQKLAAIGCQQFEGGSAAYSANAAVGGRRYAHHFTITRYFKNCYIPARDACGDRDARTATLNTIRGTTGHNVTVCVCDLSRHDLRACTAAAR